MKLIIASWLLMKFYVLNRISYRYSVAQMKKCEIKVNKYLQYEDVKTTLNTALSWTPFQINCVEESMASFVYLTYFGTKCTWKIGSHKENRAFHAWVEIFGTDYMQEYYVLDEISNY